MGIGYQVGLGFCQIKFRAPVNLRKTGMEDIIWLMKQISVVWAFKIKVSKQMASCLP